VFSAEFAVWSAAPTKTWQARALLAWLVWGVPRPAHAQRRVDVSVQESVGSRYAVGLDIGGTKVIGVMLDSDDRVVGSVRLPAVHGVDGVVTTALSAVSTLVDAAGLVPAQLAGLGVGVPGMVNPVEGTVRHAVNLGLQGEPTPLARLLSEALNGLDVTCENDLNVAALGAAHTVGRRRDLAFLALGTGLGAGIVLDGRVRRGAFGVAGEIGHLTFDPDGPLCGCGQRGCLEVYGSGGSIDARWPSSSGTPAPVALLAAAAAGDVRAVAVWDSVLSAVATAVRVLVLTTDVPLVVLGGGVAALGKPLLEGVVDVLDAQALGSEFLSSIRIPERVVLAPPGVPVGAVGAGLLVRDRAALSSVGSTSLGGRPLETAVTVF
jgi:glucokinase